MWKLLKKRMKWKAEEMDCVFTIRHYDPQTNSLMVSLETNNDGVLNQYLTYDLLVGDSISCQVCVDVSSYLSIK